MMRAIVMGLAAVLVFAGVPAKAQDSDGNPFDKYRTEISSKAVMVSGNDLYARCTTDVNAPQGLGNYAFCRGYIYGAIDSYLSWAAQNDGLACFQDGVIGGQLADLVIDYLKDNPAIRHKNADYFVSTAIMPVLAECPTSQ